MSYLERDLKNKIEEIAGEFRQTVKEEEERIREEYQAKTQPAQEQGNIQQSLAEMAKKHRIIK